MRTRTAPSVQEFREFFRSVADELPDVLRATGCREGWVQAEAYRFFRKRGHCFWVNTEPVGRGQTRKKADFASYTDDSDAARLLFVGELKVFGVSNYQYKNLDGRGLKQYLRRLHAESSIVFKDDRSTLRQALAAKGLLGDWGRLRSKMAPSKLLVLVLDKHGDVDEFGRVIQSVEFGQPAETLLDNKTVSVKAWPVA